MCSVTGSELTIENVSLLLNSGGMTLTLDLLLNSRLLPDIYPPSFVVHGSCLDSVGPCGLW